MKPFLKRSMLVCGTLAVLILIFALPFIFRPRSEALFISESAALQKPPTIRRLSWRIREILLGQSTVVIQSVITSNPEIDTIAQAVRMLGRAPVVRDEKNALWIIDERDALLITNPGKDATPQSKTLADAKMITSEGSAAWAFMGNVVPLGGTNIDVGLRVRAFPHYAGETTHLVMSLLSTRLETKDENIPPRLLTNAVYNCRLQLPAGKKLLVISEGGISSLFTVASSRKN